MEANVHELSAGYALDALDPEEREAFEEHLAGCPECEQQLAEFWDVAAALALAVDNPAPSPELRERILTEARAERQNVVPLASKRRPVPVLGVLTAIAAAVAIGIGIYAVTLNSRLDTARNALATQEDVSQLLADPNAKTVALTSGQGKLVVSDAEAVLVLNDLNPAPAGKTYQAWVVEGSKPVSAGTFRAGSSGQALVPIRGGVPAGAVVAVTVEQGGGATTPTLPPVIASDPV